MGYEIKVDGEDNRGLQVWLQAMQGLAVDIKEHDTPYLGRGRIVSGEIVRVSPPFTPEPEVTLVTVDLHGRAIPGGDLMTIRVNNIEKVAVW